MRNYCEMLCAFGLLSLSVPSYAQQVDISSLHYAQAARQTRLIFDVSASPKHRVFVQNNPSQLVIEIKNANLAQVLSQPSVNHPLFTKIHVLEKTKDRLRNKRDAIFLLEISKADKQLALGLHHDCFDLLQIVREKIEESSDVDPKVFSALA